MMKQNNFLSRKQLIVNDEIAYKGMTDCNNLELSNIEYLYKAGCKCKNKTGKT